MDDRDETLSKRLRAAALQRAGHESERVDDFVLDADGVIDLRRLDDTDDARSVAAPPAALQATRGRLGDAGEVGHLYDDSEPDTGWLQRRRNRRRGPDIGLEPGPTATLAPTDTPAGGQADGVEPEADTEPDLTAEPATDRPAPGETPEPAPSVRTVTPDVDASTPEPEDDGTDVDLDLRDGSRPTAICPKCGASGQQDLFDRVSRTAYYSCDACTHMWQQAESD